MSPTSEMFGLVYWINTVTGLATGLVGNIVWALFQGDKMRFGGHWRGRIRWKHRWASQILFKDGCADPHSLGDIVLSYGAGSKKNQYYGLSVWRLRDGSIEVSQLAVELSEIELRTEWRIGFPPFSHQIIKARLSSRIRSGIGNFEYPVPFANYTIRFRKASVDCLDGDVYGCYPDNDDEVVVGEFHADRIS